MNKETSKKISHSQFTILEEMKNINIPFDSLKPIEPEIDTVSMFQKLKEILNAKNSDWTLQIGVINYLRRVQKFDKNVFGQFFYGAKIYPKLLDLINSVRSSVSKNALLLLNEIFSENISQINNSILYLVKATLPLLIPKINSNQSFIKVECKQLLESIVKNVKSPELLLIILQQINSGPRILISTPNPRNKDNNFEIITDLFIKSAKNLGKEILVANPQFQEMIKSLVTFYDLNQSKNVKFCKNILKEKVEVNNKKIKGTVSSIHFRKTLHERKKSFKLSKCNNTSFDKGNKSVSIKIMAKGKEAITVDKKSNLIRLHHNDENVQKNN